MSRLAQATPKRRPVFTSKGYALTSCECCDAEPVRDDGTEQLGEFNWMRTCADCGLRCCRVCMPEHAERCTGCQHARDTAGVPAGVAA